MTRTIPLTALLALLACGGGDSKPDPTDTSETCTTCTGTTTPPCTDADQDGICAEDDCDDGDPAIYVGAACDDVDPLTENDTWDASCTCTGTPITEFTDPRDNRVYAIVRLGDLVWMAENMAYADPSAYCYDDDPSKCTTYGLLYDWTTALTLCPDAWRLPTDVETTAMIDHLGGEDVAGGKLKATGTVEAGTGLWNDPNAGATDETGFGGLPGGYRDFADYYDFEGDMGGWWTATEVDTTRAWTLLLRSWEAKTTLFRADKEDWYSVRCVLDPPR